MQYFRTAQLFFKSLIECFDIFAISEHCLFDEQLDLLKSSTDHTSNCIAVSASDNPPLLSGQNAHGGVALFWKHAFDDYITPLTNIQSDRKVGIQCVFDDSNPLYILSVYLPTSSHNDSEFLEYFDNMWALYDSLSVKGYVIVMGDCNGDLGNSQGDKSAREPNQHGCKLLEFADYFNLCPHPVSTICSTREDMHYP